MTAKELIEHLSHAAPEEDVVMQARVCCDACGVVGGYAHELAAVRVQMDMAHEGTRQATYLVAGDELVD